MRDSRPVEQLDAEYQAARGTPHEIATLVELAWGYRTLDPGRGVRLIDEALSTLAAGDQPVVWARAYQVSCVCRRNATRLIESSDHGLEAIRRYCVLGEVLHPIGAALARVNYGITLCMLGRLSDAIDEFERARVLSHDAGDTIGEADALMDTAVASNMMGDDDRALAIYRELLPLYRRVNDTYHTASVLNNTAYALIGLARRDRAAGDEVKAVAHLQEAVSFVSEAIPLAETVEHADFVVSCIDTLSCAYRELEDWPNAYATLARQLSMAKNLEGRRMEAVTLGSLGEVLVRTAQHHEAIDVLRTADDLFQQIQLCEQHADAVLSLSAAYEAAGDLKQALEAYKRFYQLESLFKSQVAQDRMRTMEARLRLERTEAELALVKEREAALAKLNERLIEVDRERTTLLAELERQSLEDVLTGLYNRRALDHRLRDAFRHARQRGRPLALVLVDLDFFKRINDECSHAVGDEVLRGTAALLRASVRPGDFVARYGGEEFIVIMPDTTLVEAVAVAERMRQTVESHTWDSIPGLPSVTLSAGVAELGTEHLSPKRLLMAADHWLYAAKEHGRNRVCYEGVGVSA